MTTQATKHDNNAGGGGNRRYPVGDLVLTLDSATQRVASLEAAGVGIDFTPGDRLAQRTHGRFYHLGDVTFSVRQDQGPWRHYSSAGVRAEPLLDGDPTVLSAADLTANLPTSSPLAVRRHWLMVAGRLVLRFTLHNVTPQALEVGALGVAMVFNNVFTGRSLDEAHERCSLCDPYVGGDAGYLQVTRLSGQGPALLVLPERGTHFEAYRPLDDDETPRQVTFEGFHEWTILSRAYAEQEWKSAVPWNPPTSRILKPREQVNCGFVFVTAPEIEKIEETLLAHGHPVAIGLPGYVVPTDQTFRLMLKGSAVPAGLAVEPAGAISLLADAAPTAHGWHGYRLTGQRTGRARLIVTWGDARRQFIHYNVIPPHAEQVRRVAHFHQTHQWYTDTSDPFGRAFSYMPWDREADAMLMQDTRVWNAGLSDECGAGPNLLMAMKSLLAPDPRQVARLEQYVDRVLWGHLQDREHYGIKASLFYWAPQEFPGHYTIAEGCWDQARSQTTWRAYNYPHQAAVYWALYRLARNHQGLVQSHPWEWYLRQAFRTALAVRDHCGRNTEHFLSQFGLMVGTVFVEILRDLRREGWQAEAQELESYEQSRAAIWQALRYPFGSEMPWDSTGQEEVYMWCRHFGDWHKADVALRAIIAYTPLVPNWGYNGSSRRYFDTAVYGKHPRIGRGLHHYGAGLNAIPLLEAFRRDGRNLHLLRAGYAAANGLLSNIDPRGRSSMHLQADAAIIDYEPYSGDYGCAFFGHAYNAGCYVLNHAEFGWLGFGCNLDEDGSVLRIIPRDAFHRRVYVAPLRLYLTLDAGTFEQLEFDCASGRLCATLSPATAETPAALVRVEEFATGTGNPDAYSVMPYQEKARGLFRVALGRQDTRISILNTARIAQETT